MSDSRTDLLERVVDEVARHGLGDRSLRDLAAAVGTSHRMLHYHFGSRDGLVAAIVAEVETQQRALLADADPSTDPREVARAVWRRVSDPRMRPFVQLFFETAAYSSRVADATPTSPAVAARPAMSAPPDPTMNSDLTTAWIEEQAALSMRMGTTADPIDVRLGIAVVRGLLLDIIAGGDVDAATASFERFVEMWLGPSSSPHHAGPTAEPGRQRKKPALQDRLRTSSESVRWLGNKDSNPE